MKVSSFVLVEKVYLEFIDSQQPHYPSCRGHSPVRQLLGRTSSLRRKQMDPPTDPSVRSVENLILNHEMTIEKTTHKLVPAGSTRSRADRNNYLRVPWKTWLIHKNTRQHNSHKRCSACGWKGEGSHVEHVPFEIDHHPPTRERSVGQQIDLRGTQLARHPTFGPPTPRGKDCTPGGVEKGKWGCWALISQIAL